jgi:hypothetical protein
MRYARLQLSREVECAKSTISRWSGIANRALISLCHYLRQVRQVLLESSAIVPTRKKLGSDEVLEYSEPEIRLL